MQQKERRQSAGGGFCESGVKILPFLYNLQWMCLNSDKKSAPFKFEGGNIDGHKSSDGATQPASA